MGQRDKSTISTLSTGRNPGWRLAIKRPHCGHPRKATTSRALNATCITYGHRAVMGLVRPASCPTTSLRCDVTRIASRRRTQTPTPHLRPRRQGRHLGHICSRVGHDCRARAASQRSRLIMLGVDRAGSAPPSSGQAAGGLLSSFDLAKARNRRAPRHLHRRGHLTRRHR
jgi:hypothetical protein